MTYLISSEGGSEDIDDTKSIQSSPKEKIEVQIWQVPLSEDKAKSEIRQVLLTNDKAKDMEGQSNLFRVQGLRRDTHPHNDAIAIIVIVHNHMVRRVLFGNGNSNDVPHNGVMKEPTTS